MNERSANLGKELDKVSLFENNLEIGVFRLKKVLTRINIRVSMLVFGQIQIRLEIGIGETTILGFQCRASTGLGCTNGLEISSTTNLELGPQFAKVCSIVRMRNEHFFSFMLEIGLISSFRDRTFIFRTRSKDHWKKRTNKFLVFVKVQENGTNNQQNTIPPRAVSALD